MDNKMVYQLGLRDGRALILAQTHKEIKLPKQAKDYQIDYSEEHFSHNWHTQKT